MSEVHSNLSGCGHFSAQTGRMNELHSNSAAQELSRSRRGNNICTMYLWPHHYHDTQPFNSLTMSKLAGDNLEPEAVNHSEVVVPYNHRR